MQEPNMWIQNTMNIPKMNHKTTLEKNAKCVTIVGINKLINFDTILNGFVYFNIFFCLVWILHGIVSSKRSWWFAPLFSKQFITTHPIERTKAKAMAKYKAQYWN